MENYILKRYQSETGNVLSEFYQPEKQKDFTNFKNSLSLSNQFFKEITEEYLKDAFYFYEIASSLDTSISQLIPSVKAIVEVEPFCDLMGSLPNFNPIKIENLKSGCFLAQGIYPSLIIYLSEFLKEGSFAIGVVGRKHTESFKTQVKYFKQIHQQLLYMGIPLNSPIRKSNSHFGSYILTKKVKK